MKRDKTTLLIVHCSLDMPDSKIGAKEIDRRHRAEQKFGVGYHWVIRRDGTVDAGRNVDEAGIHTRGYNDRSVGICLIGGRDQAGDPYPAFTDQQMASLRELLESLLAEYPEASVYGHADLDDYYWDCPGFKVREWLDTGEITPWRDRQEGDMINE